MSEATAGRLLRELDARGLTAPVGPKRSRILTDYGQARMVQLEEAKRQGQLESDLIKAMRANSLERLLDVLRVRRAIETEAARLAALNAGDAEREALESALRNHSESAGLHESLRETHNAIHLAVAAAAKSTVTLAVLNLIFEDSRVYELQSQVLRHAAHIALPQEHSGIVRAVSSGQPVKAAKAMRAHLDRVIRIVEVVIGAKGWESA
ncbi:MAG: FCD domain-containing protein [Dehalococcoidales bacterium]|nr:FCD domain-containing protein [Dehalococcoidales bacterium]